MSQASSRGVHTLEKEMATHSSVLAWRIPGTGEPCELPSMGWHRVGHDPDGRSCQQASSPCSDATEQSAESSKDGESISGQIKREAAGLLCS